MKDYTVLGEKIKKRRLTNRHWRQEDLAKETICRVERGHQTPQIYNCVSIAKALGVTLDAFVEWRIA